MRIARWNVLLFVGTAIFIFTTISHAGLISVSVDGNDCAGFFGQGFDDCNVFGQSPVIAKFGFNDDGILEGDPEINDIFPTVTGDEWTITAEPIARTGTWTYNPDEGDPVIRFWAVKAGPQFNFSYMVPDADQEFCSAGNELELGCIMSALALPTGSEIDWTTGVTNIVSHITFYDSDGGRVPVPGTMLLMALGGLALGIRRRQRSL